MRIDPVDIDDVDNEARKVFDGQIRKWGSPLLNHRLYARRPSIFHGAQGMWGGIAASRLIDGRLKALLNVRVASLNGCVF